MKIKTMVLALLAICSTASAAGDVYVSETFIKATVCNYEVPFARCTGRVIGRTYYGQTLWSNVNLVLPYGNCGYAYVYTNPSNPFIAGDSNIYCQ